MIPTKRPKLEPLSREFIEKIINEALGVLETTGIFVENKEAVDLFRQSGMKVDESTHRVFITSSLVESSLKTTPSSFKIYDRSGEKEFMVGGDEVHFDPGSAAVTVLDHQTGVERKPQTQDLINFSHLTDILDNIHFQSTGIISGDVPESISDSYRLYIGLNYCTKPIVTGTFRVEGFKPMSEMLIAIRGSSKALKEKPLAIFDACPSPPLKWSNLTAQSLIDSARAGIPSELISMGMTGATSPVTIAGTLVQHTAENLCGLIICQLAQPGAPVVFGGSPSSFDMRKGTTPMGAIETMLIDSGYSQIGKHLNLPTHAYMGLSDAKINDNQAGFETGIGAVLAVLSGINVISGPGMLDFESCQSLEKLVIDNEICGMAYRLIAGISQRDEPIAENLFREFTKEAQFLSLPHTKKWYRQEHIYPTLIDRDNYDYWVSLGEKPIAERAHEKMKKILQDNPASRPPEKVQTELKTIMLSDAKTYGIESIPELD